MSTYLVDRGGATEAGIDRAGIEERLGRGEFFWLDLHEPSEADFDLLREVFGFHPLAVEDSEHFGQRAKCEDYDDFVFLVVYGAAPSPDEDRLVEVHCFYSERFLVTVHRDEAPACDVLRERYAKRPEELPEPIRVLYRLIDALVDSFFTALEDFDERIDSLQDEMLAGPREAQLQEIFVMRRRLVLLRRAVTPERDLFAQLVGGVTEIPGMTAEAEHYFRDVYDHLIRVSDLIDSYRDLLASGTDIYLSTVSNRLNVVMKQLAVIATIFLPLTFITGFFGQNFDWLVDKVASWPAFVGFGIGLELLAVALLIGFFKRRGWF